MPSYKVSMKYERDHVFYLEAENEDEIHKFLLENPEWQPGDVEGLIDTVSEEEEVGYELEESPISALFELVGGSVKEKAS